MDIYEKIGAKIKYARKAKRLTQPELGKELGLSRASIVNIESGRQHITLDKLIRICEVTGFRISEFLEDTGRELPERIEYVSTINKNVLERLEKIPEKWLTAFTRMYKIVGDDAFHKKEKSGTLSVNYFTCPVCENNTILLNTEREIFTCQCCEYEWNMIFK